MEMVDHISTSPSLSDLILNVLAPELPLRPLAYCVTPLLSSLLLSMLFVTLVEANCVAVRAQPELPFIRVHVLHGSMRYQLQRKYKNR